MKNIFLLILIIFSLNISAQEIYVKDSISAQSNAAYICRNSYKRLLKVEKDHYELTFSYMTSNGQIDFNYRQYKDSFYIQQIEGSMDEMMEVWNRINPLTTKEEAIANGFELSHKIKFANVFLIFRLLPSGKIWTITSHETTSW